MVAIKTSLSIDEFLRLEDTGIRWELVAGELVEMNAARANHSAYSMLIGGTFLAYLRPQRLGRVYSPDAGFVLSTDPPTVRMADVSVILADRLGEIGDPDYFIVGPPDLAVEIISPTDRRRDVDAKAAMWLAAGVRLLWVVDPPRRNVTVHAPGLAPRTLSVHDELDGGELLPGFRLPVAEIFSL